MDRTTLLALMSQGATIITANNRLAMELQREAFQASNTTWIEKPSCFPYPIFLHNAFNAYCHNNPHSNPPMLLTAQQQRHLWVEIIQQDQGQTINHSLADAVQEAWSRCLRWGVEISDTHFNLQPQTQQFQHWALEMQQRLQKIPAITNELLVDYLIKQQGLPHIETCVWVCFDDFTPEQKKLQEYMTIQGCAVLQSDLLPKASQCFLYEAQDDSKQYEQLIYWLQGQVDQGKSRIGVVVPDLETSAPTIKRLIKQYLPEESYDISLGSALDESSLVSHALSWLGLDGQAITRHQAHLLLHSPFLISSKTELLSRGQILQDCLLLQEELIPFAPFLKAIKQYAPELERVLSSLKPYPASASPSEWFFLFSEQLANLGFPGEYSLSSTNYQHYQRFLSLLEEFKQLQLITPLMSITQALTALERLANTTIFQAKKNPTSIQILGLLEAAGCLFDSLWVTGMTSECLPKKAKLSAFIPVSLQQEKLMPHACPAKELRLAEKQIVRLQDTAALCIFSFPRFSQDKPNLPTPFFTLNLK